MAEAKTLREDVTTARLLSVIASPNRDARKFPDGIPPQYFLDLWHPQPKRIRKKRKAAKKILEHAISRLPAMKERKKQT